MQVKIHPSIRAKRHIQCKMAPKQRARDYVVMWPHCFTGELDRGPKREKELAQRLVTSLRSKRFQSSYCAKVRAEAKKRLKGEGLVPVFLTNLARKRLLRRLPGHFFLFLWSWARWSPGHGPLLFQLTPLVNRRAEKKRKKCSPLVSVVHERGKRSVVRTQGG